MIDEERETALHARVQEILKAKPQRSAEPEVNEALVAELRAERAPYWRPGKATGWPSYGTFDPVADLSYCDPNSMIVQAALRWKHARDAVAQAVGRGDAAIARLGAARKKQKELDHSDDRHAVEEADWEARQAQREITAASIDHATALGEEQAAGDHWSSRWNSWKNARCWILHGRNVDPALYDGGVATDIDEAIIALYELGGVKVATLLWMVMEKQHGKYGRRSPSPGWWER